MLYIEAMGYATTNEKGTEMNITNKYWREDDDALATEVNGVTTYHGADKGIVEVAAEMGLTKNDFELLA